MTSWGRVCIPVALLLLPATSTAFARPMFPYPLTPPTPTPMQALTADLDDDGALDLLVMHAEPSELHVHLGKGDGSFKPAVVYTVGISGYFGTLGDFDGDGREDLAIAADLGSEGVAILMGNGDGTFDAPTPLINSNGANEVVVGDFDSDEILDLVTPGGSRDVFFGHGDGTFGPGLALLSGTQHAAVGDFNGDTFDDVASSQPGTDGVRVYLSNGQGNFSSVEFFATGDDPGQLVARDVNGDQLPDLLVSRTYGTSPVGPNDVSVLMGRGDGTFDPPDSCLAGYEPVFVAVADVDGDDLPDLLVSNMASASDPALPSLSLFLGTGNGEFTEAIAVEHLRYGGFSIAVGDFDGDGNEDLAKPGFYSDEVGVLFGNGDGTFVIPGAVSVGEDPQSIVVADLDDDGRLDLVTANQATNDVSVSLADGAGSFAPESRFGAGTGPVGVVVAEFTGDTYLDLAVANGGSNDVSLLPGNGDGSFAGPTSLPIGGTFVPSSVAEGHFNGDEHEDLVVTGHQANRVALFAGNGDGTFGAPTFSSVGREPLSVAVGDFDGDEIDDLAVANFDSDTISVLLGNGDGSFAAAPSLDTYFGGPLHVAVGDMNDDLRQDVVVATKFQCGGDGDVCDKPAQVFLGNGDGTFSLSIDHAYFWGNSLTILDVDGDGRLDLVGDDPVSVWLGNGDGSCGAPEFYAGYGMAVAGGDFNLDGRLDLVVADDSVPILLNRSGPSALTFESDDVTLVWPAVTGALSYNVYRGNLADLVDTDADGLPDDGYGLCITSLDGDARDTFFEDPSIPSPGGEGLFYLTAVVRASGEEGLGSTSAGLPRTPQTPCP